MTLQCVQFTSQQKGSLSTSYFLFSLSDNSSRKEIEREINRECRSEVPKTRGNIEAIKTTNQGIFVY